MDELKRYSLALSGLGYVHKGGFKKEEHDFTLDNYAPIGDCCIMLTMDSTRVLNCQISEYWEVCDTELTTMSDDGDLLDKTINTLKELQQNNV